VPLPSSRLIWPQHRWDIRFWPLLAGCREISARLYAATTSRVVARSTRISPKINFVSHTSKQRLGGLLKFYRRKAA
jgi:hypothetical protein